jgi:hypothetical protein
LQLLTSPLLLSAARSFLPFLICSSWILTCRVCFYVLLLNLSSPSNVNQKVLPSNRNFLSASAAAADLCAGVTCTQSINPCLDTSGTCSSTSGACVYTPLAKGSGCSRNGVTGQCPGTANGVCGECSFSGSFLFLSSLSYLAFYLKAYLHGQGKEHDCIHDKFLARALCLQPVIK